MHLRVGCPTQVVSEIDDPFVPQPDDLLVNLQESRGVIDTFLDTLPTVFLNNLSAESAMGPALQAAFMVINPLGGKLLLFQAAVPSLGGQTLSAPEAGVQISDTCQMNPSPTPINVTLCTMRVSATLVCLAQLACSSRSCTGWMLTPNKVYPPEIFLIMDCSFGSSPSAAFIGAM